MMFKPFLKDYAYGWVVNTKVLKNSNDTLKVISHGGGINGFNTLLVRLVEDKHLIVLLNNTGGTKLGEMYEAILNILHDKPFDMPKKSIAETLYKKIIKSDVSTAIKQYYHLKKNEFEIYDFGERELNNLGYQLLGAKKIKAAIEIFKLNVEAYPDAYNTYDSLAEAYQKDTNKQLAIKNFEKSLELNPKNTNARIRLKRLKK